MINKIFVASVLSITCACAVFAGGAEQASPLVYVGGYGGYGTVSGGYKNDGNTAQGRFALGVYSTPFRYWNIGGEFGIQSGNTMRLAAPATVVDPATGLPPQATLKPLLDFLFTVKGRMLPEKPWFYFLKGGVAFRQLQLDDRTAATDSLSQAAGEFQAGLGVAITEHAMISAFYQGIYSDSNAGVSLDTAGNTSIAHIPTQQAGFLGVEYTF